MAIHSSIVARRIPGTEEPDRLQSTGSKSQTQLSDGTFTFFSELRPGGGEKKGQTDNITNNLCWLKNRTNICAYIIWMSVFYEIHGNFF